VTVDSTTTNPTLIPSGSNGIATVTLTGLTAGSHTISAIYGTTGGFTGSNSGPAQNFSIAQASTSVTWTPTATTQQYSAAIGPGVLNATANAPGSFIYTATPSGGTAQYIHSASYLPIGTYSLGVTFVPTDSVDYAQSTASVGSYTVSKASTTAAVGATQMLVASDGTGNYTSVQAAINALPNGGSVYIKPGTYTGSLTVVQPNIALRGLGGDPTKVILTHEGGAFGSTYPYTGEFTSAQSNGAQLPSGSSLFTGDEGSATLVVAKGTNTALSTSSTIPNGFYGENFTLANTYDTDTTATTTTYEPTTNGTCTVNAGPAMTYATLYSAGTLCASQALAIWTTSDLSVMNNVYTTSLQDTIYAASQGSGSNGYVPARQYWFRGKVTGDVDYIFGDAAAVFDNTSIYTAWHGSTATGTETIEAQNKAVETGTSNDYLSGYVMNSDVFTSQSTGMTNLYLGRPYGVYSTWVMLNSYVDQVNPLGYTTGLGPALGPTTYVEFNDQLYSDPATNSPDLNGVLYLGSGGNSGAGVTGPRETSSSNPGTPMASNSVPTSMTQAQAQAYFPTNFLSQTVSSLVSSTQNWNPTAALANAVNAFVPSGSIATVAGGTSVTLLMRPQTPGLGAISSGTYTIPTGTYTLSDTYNGSTTTLASGTLDASGEAYFTTSTLGAGSHQISMTYSGDSNFSGSTSATSYQLNVSGSGTASTTLTISPSANPTYGAATSVALSVAATSGTAVPSGQVFLSVDNGAALSGTLSASGTYTFALPSLTAGDHTLSVIYNGDNTFAAKTGSSAVVVSRSILQVAANSFTIVAGQSLPTYTATITGFVNGDTQATAVNGAPSLTTSPASPSAVGFYPIVASTGTLAATNYTFTFTNGSLAIQSATRAASVATGDSRTVSEPVFPAVCATLTAALTSVSDDIPASVDATVTNPDGARIQSALNACAGTGQAVRLSMDGAGHNAYLTGPLSMPSGVTLLVDPAVFVYFSRNAQDYDVVPGTHTCGTVNNATATNSCLPLINITNVSNVGIMGYGRLDGRGGDTLINAIAPYQGQSWWGLSAIANSGGSQQNPRFIQLSNASNVTLYKITLRDSPLFHVSGSANGFTAWDIKISTPTSSRNTDGIDPDQAQNFTITRSWISDGDDNVAVGASGSASSASVNMSITNNHFFAGHGESIGSYTSAGVSNILWDSNMSSGNGTAGQGSSVNNTADSNSTGIRIKSGYDRGGVVQNIQYSNSCYQYHPTEVQFTPVYDTTPGTLTPNYKNILMQNLSFLTAGTVGLTGSSNNGVVDPLMVTLDNVSFASLPSSDMTPAPTNVSLTYGPGQVSSAFVTDYAAYVGTSGDTLVDNRTAANLAPPTCSFTYLAPELTGPAGLPQTIVSGQTATVDVILTPVVGGSSYPTGTVTLTDGASSTTTVTLPGNGDTVSIPLSNLSVGTHTFTATYSGDTNYVPAVSGTPYTTAGPYLVIVNAGSLTSTTTVLSGVPSTTTYGTSFTATATIAGSSPSGSAEFVVNGVVQTTAALNSAGVAQASFNLPVGSYSVSVIYSGDAVNAGSSSSSSTLVVGPAVTSTTLSAGANTTTLGHPVSLTATVTSLAGSPSGTVNFTYSTTSGGTQTLAGSATLSNGTATASVDLPQGTIYVIATYVASGSYATSSSTPPIAITVNFPAIAALSNSPIALPYTMSTLAGGSGLAIPSSGNMACTGATDKYGDGCQATAISFTASDDMRAVVGDPFGNVYISDISAELVRRIAPNGVITNFAGRVTGTACVPGATTGCTPTLVSISKPRGVGSDAAGNIYIADYSLNKVFKVSVANGLMYLVAGTGTAGTTGDGGLAASAEVDAPRGAWGDAVGNIYIADTSGNKIRLVDPNGIIHTFAGNGTSGSTGDGGPATSAEISNPQGVIVDVNLNVYIADSSGAKIRVVCVTCGTNSPLDALLGKLGITSPVNGDIYTIAGGATANPTSYPVLGTKVLMSPQKLALDNAGNLYISDGNGIIWFLDFHTANIRPIAGGTTTACSGATDSIGDGCPGTQAIIGDGGNGIGVGSDPLGNIYISDTLNDRIRKVSTDLASASIATGSAITQPVLLHFTSGDSPASTNAITAASTEWQLGAPTCTTNSDNTDDCLVSSAFTPAVPGPRMAALTVNSSVANTAYLGLTGTGLGAGATLDPASQTLFGANLQIAGLATDNAGNIYAADSASKQLLRFAPSAVAQGATATAVALATLTAPSAVAVDPRGFVYVSDTATGLITQISPAGVTATMANKFTTPAGLAVDSLNNVYVSDSSAQAVYQLNPFTGAQRTLAVGSLIAPAGLAVDPSGNLLITDPGADAIYRFNLQSGVSTSISSPAVKPSAIATDAAGNLLIADTAALYAVPASSNSAPFTIASLAPSSLAIDSAGDLYTGLNGAIAKLTRTQGYISFPSATSSAQNATLLESGNQALTLSSIAQSDTTDYSLTSAASPDCTLNGMQPASLALGGTCTLTASFTPTTYANPTDTLTFNGNQENSSLSVPSVVQLVLTGPAVAPTPSIALAPFSPMSPVYGQSVTVSATVSGTSVMPLGSVVFTVDGSTQSSPLVNGVASLSLTSLSRGSHSVSASYSSSNGYASVSTAVSTLTVSPAPQTITFPTPTSPVTFGVTPITLSATGGASGNPVVFTVVSGPGTISGTTLTITGAGTIQIAANQAGNADYSAATQLTQSIVVNQASQTIRFTAPTSPVTLGVAPITLSATGGTSGNSIVFSVLSGPGTISGTTLTVIGAGTIQIAANQAGNANFAAAAQVTQSIVVNKAVPAITLQSSGNPALVQNSITLTAAVSSSITAPTGSVAFMDGSTLLGTGTITGGVASLTTASLAVGSHSITAIYSGDANFLSLTSSQLTQLIEDFSLSVNSAATSTLTLLPGGTGTFTLTLGPSGASTFPSAVTLSLSGLPPGATYTFSPSTLAAGAGTTTVTLTIQLPQSVGLASPMRIDGKAVKIETSGAAPLTAQRDRGRQIRYKLPLALAMLLLPFARRLRRGGRRLRRGIALIVVAGAAVATIAGLGGCGSSGSGFFAQAPQTYTLTVTGTSGSLSRSTNLTLTVE
jgi:polygalacturonase/sugar lactone lactonase YvrE